MIDAGTGNVVVPIEELAGADAEETAQVLLAAGFAPTIIYPPGVIVTGRKTPESGKRPMGEGWGDARITPKQITARFGKYPDAGVGLCLGPGRAPGGLWLIDPEGDDGPGEEGTAEASLTKLCGGPVVTAGWSSTRGRHPLMVVEDEERFQAIVAVLGDSKDKGVIKNLPGLPNLELRVGGTRDGRPIQVQSACPPTIGANGQPRQWNGTSTIAALPEAAYVMLEQLAAPRAAAKAAQQAAAKAAQQAAAIAAAANGHASWDPSMDPYDVIELEDLGHWFRQKLIGQAHDVAETAQGNRHRKLLAVARTMGGYVANEIVARFALLDEATVTATLRAAGEASGLDLDEVDEAIADGIAYGKDEPLAWPSELDLPGACAVEDEEDEVPVDDDPGGGDDGDDGGGDDPGGDGDDGGGDDPGGDGDDGGGDDPGGDGDDGGGDKAEPAAAPHADAGAGNGEPAAPPPPKKLRKLTKATVAAAIAARDAALAAGADHGDDGDDEPEPDPPPKAGKGPARPIVEITPRRNIALARTLEALPQDEELFRRGDLLVTLAVEPHNEIELTSQSVLRNTAGAPRVVPLSPAVLGCRLAGLCDFKMRRRTKAQDGGKGKLGLGSAHPPAWLVGAVATVGSYPGVRPLLALVEAPFLRGDGTIVESPGYDEATGTYYVPGGAFPPVPQAPTQADVQDAVERIAAYFLEFPFRDPARDFAVTLSALLTLVARPAIEGPVPGTSVIGNVAGCGKGLLVDALAIAATGRPAPTTTYPRDREESGKVTTSIALGAQPVVHFDNVEEGRSFGNGPLDSALTSRTINDRVLGLSKFTGEIALRSCWFISGNNITPAGDAPRRWLPIFLASPLEHPEEREDIVVRDLRAHVRAHRGAIVRDALTILRAHALAGYPAVGKARLGSFEQWDRVVRGAVHFAFGADPVKNMREAADDAPDRQQKVAMLAGWAALPNGTTTGTTVNTVLAELEEYPTDNPTLHAALLGLSKDGSLPSARTVGYFLRGMAGATIDGRRFERVGQSHHQALWRVVSAEPVPDPPAMAATYDPDGGEDT